MVLFRFSGLFKICCYMPDFRYRQRWLRRSQLLTQRPPARTADWLFDTSSLTSRLIQYCGSSFNVRLLSQAYTLMHAEEKNAMGLNAEQAALVRQVLLCDAEKPLVYARTVIPVSTLQGALRRYANLGERPLGAMLFADRSMSRGEMEVTSTLPQRCCKQEMAAQNIDANSVIWGRRSVFRVTGKPILVSEYFLPALFEK